MSEVAKKPAWNSETAEVQALELHRITWHRVSQRKSFSAKTMSISINTPRCGDLIPRVAILQLLVPQLPGAEPILN